MTAPQPPWSGAGGDAPAVVAAPSTRQAWQPAPLWLRALSWLIDGVIVMIPVLIFTLIYLTGRVDISGGASMEELAEDIQGATPLWLSFLPAVARAVYDTLLLGTAGRTPGMIVTRLRAVSATGERLELWQAGIRSLIPALVQFIPLFGLPLLLVVYLSAVWSGSRQGLHDRAAGSVIIRSRPETMQPPDPSSGPSDQSPWPRPNGPEPD